MVNPQIIQSKQMFFHAFMMNIIVIIHISYVQSVTIKGLCILEHIQFYFWHSLLLILTLINQDTSVCRLFITNTSKSTPFHFTKSQTLSPIFFTMVIDCKFLLTNIYVSSPIQFLTCPSQIYQSNLSTHRKHFP